MCEKHLFTKAIQSYLNFKTWPKQIITMHYSFMGNQPISYIDLFIFISLIFYTVAKPALQYNIICNKKCSYSQGKMLDCHFLQSTFSSQLMLGKIFYFLLIFLLHSNYLDIVQPSYYFR
jgi:hypothetical protein